MGAQKETNRGALWTSIAWIALGVGCALIYAGAQTEPGLEGILALGFMTIVTALFALGARYLR